MHLYNNKIRKTGRYSVKNEIEYERKRKLNRNISILQVHMNKIIHSKNISCIARYPL